MKKKEWQTCKYLSIDECANHKGHQDFKIIVVDLEKHQLLEVIDSHKNEEICERKYQKKSDYRSKR